MAELLNAECLKSSFLNSIYGTKIVAYVDVLSKLLYYYSSYRTFFIICFRNSKRCATGSALIAGSFVQRFFST